jgi:hypothetical protein
LPIFVIVLCVVLLLEMKLLRNRRDDAPSNADSDGTHAVPHKR